MKKNLLIIAAIASATLVSCSSDEFGGEENYPIPVQDAPIAFGSYFKAMTRADVTGAEAAALLGNKFVVSGYKGNSTATVGSMVFDNYLVEYTENTANTTESNSSNWEYVGKGLIKHAIDAGITAQKIKYWDYSQGQYDFIAWSTGKRPSTLAANLERTIYEGTPAAGQVLVSAIDPGNANTKAYTFEGKAEDLQECYIADLVTVNKSTATPGVGELAGYNQPVIFKFRQLGIKVRIGIYETVPGYSVKDVKFYTTGDVLTDVNNQIVENATIYSVGANIYTEGKYTVSFPTVDTPTSENNNQAHVTFTPKDGATQATVVDWGKLNYTIAEDGEKTPGNVFLGRTSNTASFAGDAANNYYEIYMPNESGTNLNLRVDFTLESTDGSGEEINVKNAKAQVPSIYTTWKPGFAYTYLFKISDKTNGRTGVYDPTQADDATINSDPAGLYPITFDAIVVNAEDGDNTQETITLVATPSITTYQQKSTVVNADEYTVNGKDIFVTVNENKNDNNDNLVTLTDKAALYIIPAGKTEAEVIDALQMQDDDKNNGAFIKGRSGLVLTPATKVDAASSLAANKYMLTNSVEFGADGNAISVSTDQALRFTPAAGTTYAFVYTKKAAASANDEVKYQALNWGSFDTGQTKYRYGYKTATTTDAQKGVKYFSRTGDAEPYTYTMQTPFIGQGVNNLYINTGTTQAPVYTKATGYAVTATKYYYGSTYKEAHNVAYSNTCANGLYEWDATANNGEGGYKPTEDNTPADGKAYYYKDNDKYIYCVFLPQQTTGWYVLDTDTYEKVGVNEAKVVGQTYFDKYTKNNGEYYTKVIKVQ